MPQYRETRIPAVTRNGATVVMYDEAHFEKCRSLFADLEPRPAFALLRTSSAASELTERLHERFLSFNYAIQQVHRDIVLCTHEMERRQSMQMIMKMWRLGRTAYFISDFSGPRPKPFLFEEAKDKILEIVNNLADDTSVICYLARLKAIIMGEPGYQQMSLYDQYSHPDVRVESGDVVCDAGVGTSADSTLGFAKIAGRNGRVFAFEPIKSTYDTLAPQVARVKTIEMVPMGLWSKPGEVEMFAAGDISTFRAMPFTKDKQKELCQLTSVDAFFESRGLVPSIIKMDIEGAESAALRGAEAIIRKHSPRLQICLYHSINDFISIPLQIRKYFPGYRIFIGHHTPFFNECVMYARSPSAKPVMSQQGKKGSYMRRALAFFHSRAI
jgi:FkbM family methyltransferase